MSTIRTATSKTWVPSLPFRLPILMTFTDKGRNRFIDEWSENSNSLDFWNSLANIYSLLDLDEEGIFRLATCFWMVWHPRTRVRSGLTETEKVFLLALYQRSQAIKGAVFFLHVDAESNLPNNRVCFFNTLNELLYLLCCSYTLKINLLLVPIFSLMYDIQTEGTTGGKDFQRWYRKNIICFDTERYLSLGLPPASTSPFPWWPIESWMKGNELPIKKVNELLTKSGIPQMIYQEVGYLSLEK